MKVRQYTINRRRIGRCGLQEVTEQGRGIGNVRSSILVVQHTRISY